MAAPTYTNAGTGTVSSGSTSRTPGLPASRVNGNILIAICGSKNNATHSISGSGWQALGTQTNSGTGLTVSLWWRLVDGSETQPTISWSGSVACRAIIWQFTRQNFDSTSPFGTIGTPGTGTTSTHTSTGFNSTRNNSLIVYIDMAAANTALAQPSGWTERNDAGSPTGAMRSAAGDKTLATSGSATGDISVTGANAAWVQWQIELLEPLISGNMPASESGTDTASLAGNVIVQGTLAVSEAGADTAAFTGTLPAANRTGTIDATETGSDTAAVAGVVLVQGSLSASETGSDTASLAGGVLVKGALATSEAGTDTAAVAGVVFVRGALAANEAGSDTAAMSGAVAWPTASGALVAVEAGSDTASLDGIVFTAPRIGSFATVEIGSDTAGFAGVITGEGFLWFPVSQPSGDWLIGAASGTWTAVSTSVDGEWTVSTSSTTWTPVSGPATDWT